MDGKGIPRPGALGDRSCHPGDNFEALVPGSAPHRLTVLGPGPMFIIMPNRFRAAALSVVLLLLGLFLSQQVAAEADPTWPGLPKQREPTDGGALWLGLSVRSEERRVGQESISRCRSR